MSGQTGMMLIIRLNKLMDLFKNIFSQTGQDWQEDFLSKKISLSNGDHFMIKLT